MAVLEASETGEVTSVEDGHDIQRVTAMMRVASGVRCVLPRRRGRLMGRGLPATVQVEQMPPRSVSASCKLKCARRAEFVVRSDVVKGTMSASVRLVREMDESSPRGIGHPTAECLLWHGFVGDGWLHER